MTRILGLSAGIVAAVALALSAGGSAAERDLHSTTICAVDVDHALPAPDDSDECTPGVFADLTQQDVCDGDSPRTYLSAADRREVLGEYGVPNWSGSDGELDHRVPVFLGGLTEPENVWPERGSIPNAKDRVEYRVYRRVCFADPSPMRVRSARRLFLADWRHAYRVWREDGTL